MQSIAQEKLLNDWWKIPDIWGPMHPHSR